MAAIKQNRIFEPEAPNEQLYTTWYNPLDVVTSVDIMTNPGKWSRYRIQPKSRTLIPSDYDYAIQVVRDGVIHGGMAPLWVKEGTAPMGTAPKPIPEDERPQVHPALDSSLSEAKAAEEIALKAYQQKIAAEQAIVISADIIKRKNDESDKAKGKGK
jgi:hypothetical protein